MQPLAWASSLGAAKIYLYCQPVDMRKSFAGLHALVPTEFQRDIRAGDLFLFLNRRVERIIDIDEALPACATHGR